MEDKQYGIRRGASCVETLSSWIRCCGFSKVCFFNFLKFGCVSLLLILNKMLVSNLGEGWMPYNHKSVLGRGLCIFSIKSWQIKMHSVGTYWRKWWRFERFSNRFFMGMGFGVERNATLLGYCGFCVARKKYPFLWELWRELICDQNNPKIVKIYSQWVVWVWFFFFPSLYNFPGLLCENWGGFHTLRLWVGNVNCHDLTLLSREKSWSDMILHGP